MTRPTLVVAACLAGGTQVSEVAGVPVVGDLDDTAEVVRRSGASTVAVLPSPEMDGVRLRQLAWELEKTGTDLCVAPALLDVAGPRTTIRPTAGLTLLHVDHPQLSGPRQVMKDLVDRVAAGVALLLLSPLMLVLAISVRLSDRRPALFKQFCTSYRLYRLPDQAKVAVVWENVDMAKLQRVMGTPEAEAAKKADTVLDPIELFVELEGVR